MRCVRSSAITSRRPTWCQRTSTDCSSSTDDVKGRYGLGVTAVRGARRGAVPHRDEAGDDGVVGSGDLRVLRRLGGRWHHGVAAGVARPSRHRRRPWPNAEIRILDPDGAEAAVGEHGQVWMLAGALDFDYHKSGDRTAASKRDGFFTVGDIGHVDEEGYLYLHGRSSDIIITGGVNVHPSEVEAVLHQHAAVDDVAVFGIPDPEWGEQIKAVIQPAPGVGDELAVELLAFCRERLAAYKVPRSIDFVPQLPRDPNGKLYKRQLRDPYWTGQESA